MFKVILWDIDNTLLDFLASEQNSIKTCFDIFKLGECADEMVKRYSAINIMHWEMLERGEISKEQVKVERFREFFREYGITSVTPEEFTKEYEAHLCDTVCFLENGYEIVSSLKGKYKQYAVTNGALNVQAVKLEKSGLNSIFDGVFISDEIGFEKPNKAFFDYALNNIIPCKKEEIIIIGDSLTSDMKGGNNAKIKCCWYNPKNAENTKNLRIDYEIHSLNEIYGIL